MCVYIYTYIYTQGAPLMAQAVKNIPLQCSWFDLWVGNIPWRREQQSSSRGHDKESDITEQLTLSLFIYIYVYVCVYMYMVVCNSVTPWTEAHQAPLSTEFSR